MDPDQEIKKLMDAICDIEQRILPEKVFSEAFSIAIENLRKIHGNNPVVDKAVQALCDCYHAKNMEELISNWYKLEQTEINKYNGQLFFNGSKIARLRVYRNSTLFKFLIHSAKVTAKKVYELNVQYEQAIKSGNKEKSKDALIELLTILQKMNDFLVNNVEKIVKDTKYSLNISLLITHELQHYITLNNSYLISNINDIPDVIRFRNGLNEAYSHCINATMHLYADNYVFDENNLKSEIKNIYKYIIPRKYAYSEDTIRILKVGTLLLSTLFITQAILKKEGRQLQLITDSYQCKTVYELFEFINHAIDLIGNHEFKTILKTMPFETARSQLSKHKQQILQKIESGIKSVRSRGTTPFIRNFDLSFIEDFWQCLGILMSMGETEKANLYKQQYTNKLVEYEKSIAKNAADLESQLANIETDEEKILAIVKARQAESLPKIQAVLNSLNSS